MSLAGTLTVTINYVNHVGDAYRLIDDQSSSAESNTFTGLAEGATFTIGPAVYNVTYRGGTGNDFVVTTQSIPDTWVGGTSRETGTRQVTGAITRFRAAATMSSSIPAARSLFRRRRPDR